MSPMLRDVFNTWVCIHAYPCYWWCLMIATHSILLYNDIILSYWVLGTCIWLSAGQYLLDPSQCTLISPYLSIVLWQWYRFKLCTNYVHTTYLHPYSGSFDLLESSPSTSQTSSISYTCLTNGCTCDFFNFWIFPQSLILIIKVIHYAHILWTTTNLTDNIRTFSNEPISGFLMGTFFYFSNFPTVSINSVNIYSNCWSNVNHLPRWVLTPAIVDSHMLIYKCEQC